MKPQTRHVPAPTGRGPHPLAPPQDEPPQPPEVLSRPSSPSRGQVSVWRSRRGQQQNVLGSERVTGTAVRCLRSHADHAMPSHLYGSLGGSGGLRVRYHHTTAKRADFTRRDDLCRRSSNGLASAPGGRESAAERPMAGGPTHAGPCSCPRARKPAEPSTTRRRRVAVAEVVVTYSRVGGGGGDVRSPRTANRAPPPSGPAGGSGPLDRTRCRPLGRSSFRPAPSPEDRDPTGDDDEIGHDDCRDNQSR